MLRRIWILFTARNKEFFRDRSALAWNILFPFLVIIGFSLVFNDERQILYRVGVVGVGQEQAAAHRQFSHFRSTKYVDFVAFKTADEAMPKLLHHRIDLLVDVDRGIYWTSVTSPRGYVAERLLKAGGDGAGASFSKQTVTGHEVPYIEWLFPGILGMNIMFSALFGVGYVVVNYRKNGVLKRMSVTPLRPVEFLSAQILSRMFVLAITTIVVFVGCTVIYRFSIIGSYLNLFIVFFLGGFSIVSLALLVSSRSASEEFAGGVLNLISWPMMFLSEVWFSLEGAEPWVKALAKIFPLTHMIDASRMIMNDGAGLYEVRLQMLVLSVMTAVFLTAGSLLFSWQKK